MARFNLFKKDQQKKEELDKGLEKTKSGLFNKLGKALVGKSTVSDEVLDEVEEALIASDVGVDTTVRIIERLEAKVEGEKYVDQKELNDHIRSVVLELLGASPEDAEREQFIVPEVADPPYVMLVVGVNGVGKTTTIGKLAAQLKKSGKSVVLGAADTFRAAAVDQLNLWGERVGVPVVSHGMKADPASVAHDAVKQGKEQGADVVLIDTAGRLHNKVNLMNELAKIKRVIKRFVPQAPHDVLLVLDGSTGQNAFAQAKEFTNATEVTSLAITKLDGTAKGGVVIGISDQFQIPIKYIGVGEKVDDLQVFNKYEFVDSLFKKAEA